MANKMPDVSIGLPVFNGEKYIRDALDSLLSQTYESIEIIISDNCSTDDTESICREYEKRDDRIRYFCQYNNIGIGLNFRFVLNEAKSRYFMWASCDDVWDSRWVEVLVSNIGEDDFSVSGVVKKVSFDRCLQSVINPIDINKNSYIKFLLNIETGLQYYVYGLHFTDKLKAKAMESATQVMQGDVSLVYAGIWEGNLRTISSVYRESRSHKLSVSARSGGESTIIKIIRMMVLLNPVEYYFLLIRLTPDKYKFGAFLFVFVRYLLDQHRYWSLVFGKLKSRFF